MKNKNDIPWYFWRFSVGAVFLILILGFTMYNVMFKSHNTFDWMDISFCIVLLLLICWLVKSEWMHRKPRHFKPDN